jgi:hypothetical protein
MWFAKSLSQSLVNFGKHNKTKANTMTLDQICNGKLEQQIRDGLAKLVPATAKAGKPRIFISVYADGSGYIGLSVENNDELSSYGFNSIPEAVYDLIKKLNDPEATDRRRKAIEQKIASLEAELRELPTPAKPTPESAPVKVLEPALMES